MIDRFKRLNSALGNAMSLKKVKPRMIQARLDYRYIRKNRLPATGLSDASRSTGKQPVLGAVRVLEFLGRPEVELVRAPSV